MINIYYSSQLNQKFLDKLKQELMQQFKGCRKIAIKIHFGEPGNEFAFKPEQVRPVIDLIRELGFDYFLFDSSVAYGGRRGNPEEHKKYAAEKGWARLGEIITDESYIEQRGKHLTYQVCKQLTDADAVLVISHVKGHICSGFGGAVKNLGMGALTKKSKSDIHDGGKPVYVGECVQCGACAAACPLNTIKIKDKPVFGTCYGCSDCIYACPEYALRPKIELFDVLLADGAFATQKNFKKYFYISFLTNITKECDCEQDPKCIIAENVGYLAGKDAVAIDMAAYNLITEKAGEDVFLKHNKKSGLQHIEQAELLGMGKQEYKLITY